MVSCLPSNPSNMILAIDPKRVLILRCSTGPSIEDRYIPLFPPKLVSAQYPRTEIPLSVGPNIELMLESYSGSAQPQTMNVKFFTAPSISSKLIVLSALMVSHHVISLSGKGIDLSFFPEQTEFIGDSRTFGFRCIEMIEKKPWKFQVDVHGLCVIAHMMLHILYMEVERKASPNGGYDVRGVDGKTCQNLEKPTIPALLPSVLD